MNRNLMMALRRFLLTALLALLAMDDIYVDLPLPPEPEGEENYLTACTTWRSPADVGDFYCRGLEEWGWTLEQEPVEILPAGHWRLAATRPGWVLIAKWWYEADDLCLHLEVLDENLDKG